MLEEKTDLELIEDFKAGEQLAFEELVSRYTDRAFSLASRMTRNTEDAEEVLQDVFVTVYRKIHGFEGKSSFSSWLYRVTVNASLMKIRKRKQDLSTSIEDISIGERNSVHFRSNEEENGDHITLRKEVLTELEAAIMKLPDDYRPVFILRDIDGLTSKEVGKILNLSVPAVKSRLHRSRLMLRKKLAAFYREYSEGSGRIPLSRAGNL